MTTPFRLTETCNAQPLHGDPSGSDDSSESDSSESDSSDEDELLEDAVIVAPGEPEASALYLRMVSEKASWRMPPMGTHLVDDGGSELIADWIRSLEECPE